MIGVVIPYYQRTPGLLNRALRSVAAQAGAHKVRVYVVDDGSPAPAEAELAGLPDSLVRDIVILQQTNAGPAAARNLALEQAADDVTSIAFLDSDDAWGETHLDHVGAALGAGADFYFADHKREDDGQSRFVQCGYKPEGDLICGAHGAIRWCDARALFRAIILRSPVGTSTVAIRRSRVGDTRFPPHLRTAGEDSIFWLTLLTNNVRAACGVAPEVAYGRGVSLFNHRSWGDARSLRTTLDQMRAHRHVLSHFSLDDELAAHSRMQLCDLDRSYCANLIACGSRLHWAAAGPAFSYLALRPMALLQIPRTLSRAVRRHAKEAPS